MTSLEKEFHYYLEKQSELAKEYDGKILVIKGQKVISVHEDRIEAIKKTAKDHELGTFLVQECSSDLDSTKQTFHSRAIFA